MSKHKALTLAERNFAIAELATTLDEAKALFLASNITLKRLDDDRFGAYGVVVGCDSGGYFFYRTTEA